MIRKISHAIFACHKVRLVKITVPTGIDSINKVSRKAPVCANTSGDKAFNNCEDNFGLILPITYPIKAINIVLIKGASCSIFKIERTIKLADTSEIKLTNVSFEKTSFGNKLLVITPRI